jgi:DNA-binding NarL/FixJ family response regulator
MSPEVARRVIELFRLHQPPQHAKCNLSPQETRLLRAEMAIRVLIADDHRLFRDGLRRILEDRDHFEVVAEAATGIEAVELARQHRPDVAVVDVTMPELNGSRSAGAKGYLLEDTAEEGLAQAIPCVSRGEEFFSPAVAGVLATERTVVEDRYETLTERERQLYQLLGEGGSNKDIAGRLDLSLHTVETHRTRIMEKMASISSIAKDPWYFGVGFDSLSSGTYGNRCIDSRRDPC